MLPILLALSVTSGASDVEKAERLYADARYVTALKALGKTCDGAQDVAACERLRAFILIALGRNDGAVAAFHRMLDGNPDADLGPDASPKFQRMFGEAKRAVIAVRGLEVEPVDLAHAKTAWPIKVYAPQNVELESITVYLAPPGRESFAEAPLTQGADAWVADVDLGETESGLGHYYLTAVMQSGVTVSAGTETEPRDVDVRVLGSAPFDPGDGNGNGNGPGNSGSPFGVPGVSNASEDDGLPTWAVWSIVGGVAVVVATGAVLAVLLSRDEKSGTIIVTIGFDGDP
ncbi:MAG: hypothetical protein V3T05_13595 [Myxococcota bacterium]